MTSKANDTVVPDILSGPWKAIGSYEVNRYGVVRKGKETRGLLREGQILRPIKKSSRARIMYSLTVNGQKRMVSAENLVQEVHGREIQPVDGLYHKILGLIGPRIKEDKLKPEQVQPQEAGNRRCHDCGRPTFNYRCDECWAGIRGNKNIQEPADFGCGLALSRAVA